MVKRLKKTGGGDRLTADLLTEVLLRVPLKSLLRSKSVCKSWLALISSHRFAKSHLIASAAAGDDQNLIVHVYKNEEAAFKLFYLDSLEFGPNLKLPYSQGMYPFALEFPFHPPSVLTGSDCGIVCVKVDVSNWAAAKNKTDIYLWNPATQQSKLIPPCTVLRDDNKTTVALGFGFDHVDFDFKVVRVAEHRNTSSAEVYSSNRNAWRNIDSKLIQVPYDDFHVCLHGFLFNTGDNGMMAFDLNKELFICDINIPVRPFDDDSEYFKTRIAEFKDSIAIIFSEANIWSDKIKLWKLDDETCLHGGGVKASWTLMLNINLGEPLQYVDDLFNSVEFLVGTEDGSQLLYNSDKKVTRLVPDVPDFDYPEVFKYTESLFSLAGSKRVNWTASTSDDPDLS